MPTLEAYREIVGDEFITSLYRKARRLYGKHIIHINSTYQGGGVAEMLSSLVPLMNDIGIATGWRILHGTPDFFDITKKFHNALQGSKVNLTKMKKELYRQVNRNFSIYTHIDHDCVIIHDPQPLPLIECYPKRQPWVWRAHIDLSAPNEKLWEFLKGFIFRYDMILSSNERYISQYLPVERRVIYPAIDTISVKNKELSEKDISKYLGKFGIPTDKPLVTQISRFDVWKDPDGVIRVFNLVRKEVDARLVLCGSMSVDDPEGWEICEKVTCKARNLLESGDVILITSENNILVNVLQRTSAVIVQKSLREGFGLTVTEALWKETPVVASNIGGIPLQIRDGENGFLVDPLDTEGFADRIITLLKDPSLAKEMGRKGKKIVQKHFLITRLLADYLAILDSLIT